LCPGRGINANLNLQIRPVNNSDMNDIVQLSLLAWEPVFIAWEQILGPKLYPIAIYPDWRVSQKEAVEKVCHDEKITTWVAEVEGEWLAWWPMNSMTLQNWGSPNARSPS